jgi:hypothetical protein
VQEYRQKSIRIARLQTMAELRQLPAQYLAPVANYLIGACRGAESQARSAL